MSDPSFFELVAQECMIPSLRPAIYHMFTSTASWYPSLSWLNKYKDEVFFALLYILEVYHLRKYNSSFSANFYGLHYQQLKKNKSTSVEHTSSPLLSLFNLTTTPLDNKAKNKLLFLLVILPYIRVKLENLYYSLVDRFDSEGFENSNRVCVESYWESDDNTFGSCESTKTMTIDGEDTSFSERFLLQIISSLGLKPDSYLFKRVLLKLQHHKPSQNTYPTHSSKSNSNNLLNNPLPLHTLNSSVYNTVYNTISSHSSHSRHSSHSLVHDLGRNEHRTNRITQDTYPSFSTLSSSTPSPSQSLQSPQPPQSVYRTQPLRSLLVQLDPSSADVLCDVISTEFSSTSSSNPLHSPHHLPDHITHSPSPSTSLTNSELTASSLPDILARTRVLADAHQLQLRDAVTHIVEHSSIPTASFTHTLTSTSSVPTSLPTSHTPSHTPSPFSRWAIACALSPSYTLRRPSDSSLTSGLDTVNTPPAPPPHFSPSPSLALHLAHVRYRLRTLTHPSNPSLSTLLTHFLTPSPNNNSKHSTSTHSLITPPSTDSFLTRVSKLCQSIHYCAKHSLFLVLPQYIQHIRLSFPYYLFRLRQLYAKWFVRSFTVYEVVVFLYQLLSLLKLFPYWSPSLHLARITLAHKTEVDHSDHSHNSVTGNIFQRVFSHLVLFFGDRFKWIVMASILTFRFLEWHHSTSASQGERSSRENDVRDIYADLPIPESASYPNPVGLLSSSENPYSSSSSPSLTTTTINTPNSTNVNIDNTQVLYPLPSLHSLCPICVSPIVNPLATNTGYLFCYTCLNSHLKKHTYCPITGLYTDIGRTRRIFDNNS